MNTDQFRGRIEEIKGWVERFAGRMTGSRVLIERGTTDLAVGLARARFGDVREAVRKRSEGKHRRPTA